MDTCTLCSRRTNWMNLGRCSMCLQPYCEYVGNCYNKEVEKVLVRNSGKWSQGWITESKWCGKCRNAYINVYFGGYYDLNKLQ